MPVTILQIVETEAGEPGSASDGAAPSSRQFDLASGIHVRPKKSGCSSLGRGRHSRGAERTIQNYAVTPRGPATNQAIPPVMTIQPAASGNAGREERTKPLLSTDALHPLRVRSGEIPIGDRVLPVRFLEFNDHGRRLYVAFLVEEVSALDSISGPLDSVLVDRRRLEAVLKGCRNEGQRFLEVGLWGASSQAEARTLLEGFLRAHIESGPQSS
jgi:hypothetical protein